MRNPGRQQLRPVLRLFKGRWSRLGLVVVMAVVAILIGSRFVPLPADLERPSRASLEFVDRHSRSLRILADDRGLVARSAAESAAPASLMLATQAAEDARFRSHSGVDVQATARAAWQWVRNRRVISGASTITQQVIKLAHPRPRTLKTKLIEAAQAIRLEQCWDKDRILSEYLMRLDYGNRCEGVREAARHYFGKSPKDLDLAEAALLAGLPQAPTRLNPRLHWERAKARQVWILGRMRDLGWIDESEAERAKTERLVLAAPVREFLAPHFVDYLRQTGVVLGRLGPLRTTLDLELQNFCEQLLKSHLAPLKLKHVGNGAVVIIDNRSSELLACVGGVDWFEPVRGQVNAALARRSPGSALKPFTYALAFEAGATAADVVPDVPTEFPTPTGVFRPLNYDHHCHGPVRLRPALANSLNIPAVRVLKTFGGPAALRSRLHQCGLTTLDRSSEDYGLGLTLGDGEVRLLELSNAYAALARLGEWRPLRFLIPDSNYKAGEGVAADSYRVYATDVCWLVADILADAEARSMAFGIDSPLRFDFPVACKTGTSSDFRDNWAFAYTPEFTVGVWVGNLDGTPMSGVSGIAGAAPALHDIVQHLHETHGTTWYAPPPGIQRHRIDPLTGHRLDAPGSSVSEVFLEGHLSSPTHEDEYDGNGRVLLGPEYAEWAASSDNLLRDQVVVHGPERTSPFRVIQPLEGTIYFWDADIPAASQRLRLKANRPCRWKADDLPVSGTDANPEVQLVVGRHRILAVDSESGAVAESWIEVRRL